MDASIRLLPLETRSGPENMAADETLLLSAQDGVASLRFYQWSPATLSLGYFQAANSRLSDPRLAPLAYVRRLSGGQALVHHLEVTYCLALPHGPCQHGEPWRERMHRIIAAAFRSLGVELAPAAQEQQDPSTILCFRQITPGDLLCRGAKVVGSAQRKRGQCLLQHGGILLAMSSHTPSLPGTRELSGRSVSAEQIRDAVVAAFRIDTSWGIEESVWATPELEALHRLVETRYGTARWNDKK